MRKILFVSGLVLCMAAVAMAVPSSITYQGRLTDANGAPLGPDTVTVKFDIYAAASGGSSLLSTTKTIDTDEQGVFTTLISGSPSVFNGSVRYLQLTVRGTVLSPRQELTTAPYSFKSAGEPLISAGNYNTTSNISLSTTYASLGSVTANFPSAGFAMIVIQSTLSNATASNWLRVQIREGTTVLRSTYWDAGDVDSWFDQHQSHTLVIPVTAGSHTYNFQVSTNTGTAQAYYNQILVAFFPAGSTVAASQVEPPTPGGPIPGNAEVDE